MNVTNILDALKRRFWIIALFFVTIAPLGVGVAYILPPVYSASARILVESQQIPDELAQSTVTASAQERLAFLQQLLINRQNLIAVIEKHKLYANRPGMTLAQRVDTLRESITLSAFDAGTTPQRRGAPLVVGLNLTVEMDQPVLAASVANEFVTLALELNLRQRTERATETVAFFSQETIRLSQAVVALEAEIIAFKRDNADALPDGADFRRSQVISLEQTVFSLSRERAKLLDEKRELVYAIEQGTPSTGSGQVSPQQQQLEALRNTLVQQRSLLAESHPQIRALEARIAALEREVAQSAGATGVTTDLATLQLRQAERQISRLDEQIEVLDDRESELRAEIAKLRKSIDRAPQVEVELRALERRFAGLQSQYAEAEEKRSAAATGEKLEVNQQAERFVVVEQAQVPTSPDSPNRPVIAGAGVGASLALGIGLVVLLELMNKSIRSATDLHNLVGLRPIVVVPYIRTKRETWRKRFQLAILAFVFLVGVPACLYMIDQLYLPLEIVADKLMRASGLGAVIEMIERRL